MDQQRFEAEFQKAVVSHGREYLEARERILASGAAALAMLEPRQRSPDWKTALVAEILTGWVRDASRFELCTRYVAGHLGGRPPITGQFTPNQRISAILQLTRAVVPRLLEMATKTREFGTDAEAGAIFGSLIRFRDPRAVPPLIELLHDPDGRIRELAANSLGELGDRRGVPALLELLRDARRPPREREAAAMSLGTLGALEASAELEAVITDERADASFRTTAARSLVELKGAQASLILNQVLVTTADPVVVSAVIELLADAGDTSSVPALRGLEQSHADPQIREAARAARERAEERLKATP
jgi:HEAT repeat protein